MIGIVAFLALTGFIFWLFAKAAQQCIRTANELSKENASSKEWGDFWLEFGVSIGAFFEAIVFGFLSLVFLEIIPASITYSWPDWMQGYLSLLIFGLGPFLIGYMPVLLWKIYDRMIRPFLASIKESRDKKKRVRAIAKISREIERDNKTVRAQIPRLKELQAMQLSRSNIAQAEHLISLLYSVGEPSSDFLKECRKHISKRRQLLKEKEKIEGAILEIAQKFKEIGDLEKYEYYHNLVSHTTYSTSRKY